MEKLKEMTDCSVCKKIYTEPKLLPCLHTFCLGCLEEVSQQQQSAGEGSVRCPECSQGFSVPIGGCAELRTNRFAVRLTQLRQMLPSGSAEDGRCSACASNEEKSGDEVPAASMFCVDCSENLCDGCAKMHHQFRLTKNHKILSLSDIQQGIVQGVRIADQPIYCVTHPTVVENFFCSDCGVSVCTQCLLVDHKSHQYCEAEEAANKCRVKLDAELASVADHISKHAGVIHQADEEQTQLSKRLTEVEKEVGDAADEIKRLVDRCRVKMVEEIEKVKDKKLTEMGGELQAAKKSIELMEHFRKFVNLLKDKGTHAEVATISHQILERARTFSSLLPEKRQFIADVSVVSAIPRPGASTQDILGNLDIFDSESQVKNSSDLYLSTPQPMGEINGDKFVHGVVKLDRRIYVVRAKVPEIAVYCALTLGALPSKKISDMVDPVGMTLNSQQRCLYVIDDGANCVFRFATDTDEVTKWALENKPKGVSMTTDGRIIVTSQEAKKLIILSQDGSLLKEVSLPENVSWPWFAVGATHSGSGRYLISHGKVEDDVRQVCEVLPDGKIGRSYEGTAGKGDEPLKMPTYMFEDGAGHTLVVDYYTSRIFLLASEVGFVKNVLTKVHGIGGPTCIWLDSSKGVLYVGQFDGKIKAFRILKDLVVKANLSKW